MIGGRHVRKPGGARAILGTLAAVWGVLGVALILSAAIARMTPIAIDAISRGLTRTQWLSLVAVVLLMLFFEGYRGFQKSFSPRVAERAGRLRENPTLVTSLLAPLFCIGYFGSTTRLKLKVYGLTLAIVVMVRMVHILEQPWRGILDTGVLLGLTWGLVTTLISSRHVFRVRPRAGD